MEERLRDLVVKGEEKERGELEGHSSSKEGD